MRERLILASGSPRRANLLEQIGLTFEIFRPDIDETPRPMESARKYATRMSEEKMSRSREVMNLAPGRVLVCADTIVVLDDEIIGKPECQEDAISVLQRMSNRTHRVLTSVTIGETIIDEAAAGVVGAGRVGAGIVDAGIVGIGKSELNESRKGEQRSFMVETLVTFRQLEIKECEAYWNTGEPADKSGSYGIQGLGSIFVARIEGSPSNVAGLPLMETVAELRKFGIDPLHIGD
jgi:septum formation protein